ncbi:MAG: hypothetical protein J6S09_07970 [Paludibacteraceae bacterium]|nr:hypothetical protein [Paludibacteraceae bacterium]
MRKIPFFVLLVLFATSASAQQPKKPEYRPDWFYNTPHPGNATYLYVVEHGEGATKREALNQAIARVFQSTANRIGQFVSTDEINRAVQAGTDYSVIGRNMKVPINKVCEFAFQDEKSYAWTVYVLCQVAKSGSVIPEFDDCDLCNAHTIFDKNMMYYKEQLAQQKINARKAKNKENAISLVESVFVPGLGQIMKGHVTEGTFTLIGEVGLLTGGIATYAVAKNKLELLKAEDLDYASFNQLKKEYNGLRAGSYIMYVTAGALYAFNLYRAYFAPSYKHRNYAFYPTVISVDNQQLALGMGMSINF